MVIEVAKEKSEKQLEEGTTLPGWTGPPQLVPTAPPPAYQRNANVKEGCRKRKAPCFVFLLFFCVLLGLTIYFGVTTNKFKRRLLTCEESLQERNLCLNPIEGEFFPDGQLYDWPMDKADVWGEIADLLEVCVRPYGIDANCLKEEKQELIQKFRRAIKQSDHHHNHGRH